MPNPTESAGPPLMERRRVVAQALETLPPEQRQLIETAYFTGLSQSELATRFELPLGTVKTQIRAGLKTLGESLQQLHSEGI